VLFNLSAIVGSAILYGDFKTATFHQVVTFLYGCSATFAGVFIIAWAPSNNDDDSSQSSNVESGASGPGRLPQLPGTSGTLGRRRMGALVLQGGVADIPILRHRPSAVSLIGLSPAQVFWLSRIKRVLSDAVSSIYFSFIPPRHAKALCWTLANMTVHPTHSGDEDQCLGGMMTTSPLFEGMDGTRVIAVLWGDRIEAWPALLAK
jgi:hypothetical protein